MSTPANRLRRLLPSGMTGLAATACAACCVLPLLLTAGILGGAGWATANRLLPGVAVSLAGVAGLAWWWASKRPHTAGCPGGNCSCRQADQHDREVAPQRPTRRTLVDRALASRQAAEQRRQRLAAARRSLRRAGRRQA